jgi:cytochrome oxidase Cu insertion factor (SCO1/SenC/PrrC family)
MSPSGFLPGGGISIWSCNMKRLVTITAIALTLVIGAIAQAPQAPETKLKVGDTAPDFTLNDTTGNPVKLSDFRGKKNVVLAFYVLAFTGG